MADTPAGGGPRPPQQPPAPAQKQATDTAAKADEIAKGPTASQKQEQAHDARADAVQGRLDKPVAKGEEPRPGPWTPDLTDIHFPPWHPQNRGNAGYKPGFQGEVPSKEATAALKLMATGDLKLPVGCYDNITGNPAFQDPGVLNPPWRWDATGRQTQWVRP